MTTLLSSNPAADWEIRAVGPRDGEPSAEARPLAPAVKSISGRTLPCFYRDQDRNSYCSQLAGSGAEIFEENDLHHFDGDPVVIAHQIAEGLDRRISHGLEIDPRVHCV